MTSSPRPHLLRLAPPAPMPQRQLSMVFEAPVLQGMSPGERARAISQLAILLLQAAGMQQMGADDGKQ